MCTAIDTIQCRLGHANDQLLVNLALLPTLRLLGFKVLSMEVQNYQIAYRLGLLRHTRRGGRFASYDCGIHQRQYIALLWDYDKDRDPKSLATFVPIVRMRVGTCPFCLEWSLAETFARRGTVAW